LEKAIQAAENLVFIALAPARFVRACREGMRQARFDLVELCASNPPISVNFPTRA
jgi:hypothetical protein